MTHQATALGAADVQQVNPQGAADLLGVSIRLLGKWRRTGDGPRFVRLGHRCVRYRIIDLHTFQEERLRENNAAAR